MMENEQYEREAERIVQQLPLGPRVAVIGSASFWGNDSREICTVVGAELATMENLVLLTGGVTGVGEAVGRSFFRTRQQCTKSPDTYHILPRGFEGWDYGVTLFGGSSMGERREILGRLSPVYLSIEGGPGTAHEAEVAQCGGAAVVPIGRTGGFSGELYRQIRSPEPGIESEWRMLNDATASVEQLAVAVRRIIDVLLRRVSNSTF